MTTQGRSPLDSLATAAAAVDAERAGKPARLTAVVAHELATPLAAVGANLNTLHDYVGALLKIVDAYQAGGDAKRLERALDFDFIRSDALLLIRQSQDGIARAHSIVADLKRYSRSDVGQRWRKTDLNRELDSVLALVRRELRHDCVVYKEYGDISPVHCQPERIGQVFVNLLVNAGHAIADGGEIRLRTAQTGDQVRIEVSDDGCGIAPEHLGRIFDPFFTTKPSGVGTGLGLSVSADIVAEHGGRIEVDSAPGRGSAFVVTLPVGGPT